MGGGSCPLLLRDAEPSAEWARLLLQREGGCVVTCGSFRVKVRVSVKRLRGKLAAPVIAHQLPQPPHVLSHLGMEPDALPHQQHAVLRERRPRRFRLLALLFLIVRSCSVGAQRRDERR